MPVGVQMTLCYNCMANGKFVLRAYLRTELYHIIMYNPILLCSLMFGYNIPSHRSITIINILLYDICKVQRSLLKTLYAIWLSSYVVKKYFTTVFCQVAAVLETVLLKIQK